jgi:CRP-like cAMP-binding protein
MNDLTGDSQGGAVAPMPDNSQTRHYPAGTVLFREGDLGREMFVLVSGRVRLTKRVRDIEKSVATLPAGEFFGEMAILNNRPRSATCTVIEDSEMIVVQPEAFDGLIYHHREVAVRLIRRLAHRLGEANADIALLLYRDPWNRTCHALKRFARSHGSRREGVLYIGIGESELAERIGVTPGELELVLLGLGRKGILREYDEDNIVVADLPGLDRFLEYLELRHEFGEMVV